MGPLSDIHPYSRDRRARRIGLMGGSFNPPHQGHLEMAKLARASAQLDQLMWLVSPQNPLKSAKDMASFEQRMAAASDLAAPYGWLSVSRYEAHLQSAGVEGVSTLQTLVQLRTQFARAQFIWVMGADNLVQFPQWIAPREIIKMVDILVLDRPGYSYQALSSQGRAMMGRRVHPSLLGRADKPSWSFVFGPRHTQSGTALRATGHGLPQ